MRQHFLWANVVQRAACNHNDLMIVIPDARTEAVAEPRRAAWVAVCELVVEDDDAPQVCCEGHPMTL